MRNNPGRWLSELLWWRHLLRGSLRPWVVLPLHPPPLRGHRHRGDGTQHLMALQASFWLRIATQAFTAVGHSLSQSCHTDSEFSVLAHVHSQLEISRPCFWCYNEGEGRPGVSLLGNTNNDIIAILFRVEDWLRAALRQITSSAISIVRIAI